MGKKNLRSIKGVGDYWGEVKRSLNLTVTPTAIEGLENLAKAHQLSKSEFVERIGRGIIPVGSSTDTPTGNN